MMRTLLRRFGVLKSIILLTLAAIGLSIAITFSLSQILDGGMGSDGLVIAFLAPAIISPILGLHTLLLIRDLDAAEQKLTIYAFTDELTQAYNRRYFMNYLEGELAQARKNGEPLSVAIMDLDNFKAINDSHGHLVGDAALRELSRLCKSCLRRTDVLARYGGDEFVFLFPKIDPDDARRCVERIFTHLSAAPLEIDGVAVRPLFSMGVAGLNAQTTGLVAKTTSLDDLLRRADIALYQAKKDGGNRYVIG
jgi:diguanylate cyclase (GGDEF)-like protein